MKRKFADQDIYIFMRACIHVCIRVCAYLCICVRACVIDSVTSYNRRKQGSPRISSERYRQSNLLPVAIIGGGIAGAALALALELRGIPYKVFERDENMSARKQGYGLVRKILVTRVIYALAPSTLYHRKASGF